MTTSLRPYFRMLLIAGLTAACTRKPVVTPTPSFTGCRITRIVMYGADTSDMRTTDFTYNTDGTVATISSKINTFNDKTLTTFTYGQGYIIANSESSRDSLVLDSQNKVVLIDHHRTNGSPPPHTEWEDYQYSDNYVGSITHHENGSLSVQYFHWANGDLIWRTRTTDYLGFIYDTILYKTGNITASTDDFIKYGRSLITPAHVYKRDLFDSTDLATYNYSFDALGNTTHIKRLESGTYETNTEITYDCR